MAKQTAQQQPTTDVTNSVPQTIIQALPELQMVYRWGAPSTGTPIELDIRATGESSAQAMNNFKFAFEHAMTLSLPETKEKTGNYHG